jgi:hypothetical protein
MESFSGIFEITVLLKMRNLSHKWAVQAATVIFDNNVHSRVLLSRITTGNTSAIVDTVTLTEQHLPLAFVLSLFLSALITSSTHKDIRASLL